MGEPTLGRWKLGDVFKDPGGRFFRVIGFIESPVISCRAVDDESVVSVFVVGSLLESALVRYVPEEQEDE